MRWRGRGRVTLKILYVSCNSVIEYGPYVSEERLSTMPWISLKFVNLSQQLLGERRIHLLESLILSKGGLFLFICYMY